MDYYRNIHFILLKGKMEANWIISNNSVKSSTVCRGRKLLVESFLYFYGNYTRQQERMTPNFQQFYALVKEKYGDNIPQELRMNFVQLANL